ncbi:MAG: hypothetical protein QE263_02485 [Vampirovibrionales bacterium]|nr:hypothetical protein [Vampirovibrionales bacterium]
MSAITTALPAWVLGLRDFQRLGLINKAVIDVTAVDIPFIAMAKNKTEQKERILRQSLLLVIAFILAPIHSTLIARAMSKYVGFVGDAGKALNKTLMQLSYKDLGNLESFQTAVSKLFKTTLNQPLPELLVKNGLTDALRHNILKAKSHFLRLDLAVEGVLFSLIGPAKVMFGEWLSGKKQFTGEFGIVDQSTLNKLYDKQAEAKAKKKPWRQFLQQHSTLFSMALGVIVPLLGATALHRLFKAPSPTGVSRWFQQHIAPHFDYHYSQFIKVFKGVPMLSDGSLLLMCILMQISELAAARSKREVKEVAIQRSLLDVTFFFGIPAFMRLLSGSTSVQGAMDKKIEAAAAKGIKLGEAELKRIGKVAGWTYGVSYLLAATAIIGSIALGNHFTRKGVRDDAQKLELKERFLTILLKPLAAPLPRPNMNQWATAGGKR